ncbi:hypothetical protein B0H10DRAFT_2190722 [Mycena sp. CBHHK59/15]|nr:hypothetical protein B0H10DRAFT_2190722 [Mycena sp. CBHHK59/15]
MITPKFSFVPFGFRMHTVLRHQQPTKESIELAAVDSSGTQLAIARGGNVTIWRRSRGKAEWFHQETFSVPLDTLTGVPLAKNIAWIDSSAERATSSRIKVIYGVHGMITWSMAPSASKTRTRSPSSMNRPEAEVLQAAVAPDGSKALLVLAKKSGDQSGFRIYNQPSFVLEATLAAAHPPGPALFCNGSTVIASFNDTVGIWEAKEEGIWTEQAKLIQKAVSVPVTSIAHNRGIIATGQGERIVIWESTQHRYTEYARYAKSGLLVGMCLGVLAFLFPVFF